MAPIFRTKFHHEWLFDPKYSKWIMPDESSDNSVKCKVCICYIDLSNMGKASLDSHMRSKKHQTRIKEFNKTVPLFNSWIKPTPSASSSSIESMSSELTLNSEFSMPQQSTIVDYSAKAEDVSKAEIYWTLDVISGHRSFNSSKKQKHILLQYVSSRL